VWAEDVGLFQGNDLAIGCRIDQHRIEAIGRAVRGEVAQVGCSEAIGSEILSSPRIVKKFSLMTC